MIGNFRVDLDSDRWMEVQVFASDAELCEFIGAEDDAAFLPMRDGDWVREFAGFPIPLRLDSDIHILNAADPTKCAGVMFFVQGAKAGVISHECFHATLWLRLLATGRKNYGRSDVADEQEEDAAFLLERLVDEVCEGISTITREHQAALPKAA